MTSEASWLRKKQSQLSPVHATGNQFGVWVCQLLKMIKKLKNDEKSEIKHFICFLEKRRREPVKNSKSKKKKRKKKNEKK